MIIHVSLGINWFSSIVLICNRNDRRDLRQSVNVSFTRISKSYFKRLRLNIRKLHIIIAHCIRAFHSTTRKKGLVSWSWLHGSWIYNNLCNQCLSQLMLWVWIPLMASCTLCEKSLLKVALNTINLNPNKNNNNTTILRFVEIGGNYCPSMFKLSFHNMTTNFTVI
jgi:hypothetical protein